MKFWQLAVVFLPIAVSNRTKDNIYLTTYVTDPIRHEHRLSNIYLNILADINDERKFDSILLFHQNTSEHGGLEAITSYRTPKVIVSTNQKFCYKDIFNSDILIILKISSGGYDELMMTAAFTLNYMRHSRIIMIAENLEDRGEFLSDIKKLCQDNRFTNVLLIFSNNISKAEFPFYLLIPYPQYHWQQRFANHSSYFSEHWRNLHNITLMTFVEQTSSRALIFSDAQGKLQMNGFVARLLMLFAERFNATLQMYWPLKVGNKTHYTIINQMVADNMLDIPMALLSGMLGEWRNISDAYETNQIVLMVPLAKKLTTQEIFGVLLDEYFFAYFLITSLLLSLMHALIDYCLDGLWSHLDCVINHKIWPGVLGQSFRVNLRPMTSLKLIYFLVGFSGLYMTTLFSASINTLFTTPPYHSQIQTFDDLIGSTQKILISTSDAAETGNFMEPFKSSVILSTNTSYVHENRRTLNTTYCYFATSATYNILWRQQIFGGGQTFHTPKAMMFFGMLPWGFRLQFNSPYMEALNYLIHQVHSVGLAEAWQASLFMDMVKLKQISIGDTNPAQNLRVLRANDLFWVWMIVVIGLGISFVAFVFELWKRPLKHKQ